jgi:hypothetical protein
MKKTKFRLLALLFLATLFFMPTRPAYAQGPNPGSSGRVIFGENFTLEKSKTFDGDLVVFGGNVTIEEDAHLNGNLVVIGGTIKSDGETKGDVVVVGGQVNLEKSAHVMGDVVTIGSQLARAEGATIEGDVVNNVAPNITVPNGNIPPVVPPPQVKPTFGIFWRAAAVLFRAVAVALLAMLVVMFLQPQIERVGQAIIRQPVMSGGVGLLAALGAPLVIFLVALVLALTLILIPVAVVVVLLGALILTLAWLFGIIALGQEVGERFSRSINQTWAPVLTAGFGTFLLMLVGGAIGEIPCIGWLATLSIAVLGIGGVAVTRFGTQPAPLPALTVYTPPSDPGQVPPAA